MLRFLFPLALLSFSLATVPARADEQAEPPPQTQVNGYLSQRLSYQLVTPRVPVPTRDQPSLAALTEANVQLRRDLGGERAFAYADLSLVYQGGVLFYEDDGSGGRRRVPNHDVPALHPAVIPSELYVSYAPRPWLNVLVGKKRITWGAGFAFNPTDLVNPPKDPTDPNFQRAGNWLARVELPFERFTVSTLFAPAALYGASGLPYALFRYPRYAPAGGPDPRDGRAHYLLAARLYALVADADLNLVYLFSNAYQDAFLAKSRLGFSVSRYVFTDQELHAEVLLTRGSARTFPVQACLVDPSSCAQGDAFSTSKLGSTRVYPRLIVGTRRMFSDESFLSVEYDYQGDGDSDEEFSARVKLLALAKSAASSNVASPSSNGGGSLPQRYAFEPLRRHYLIVSYSKPRIADDWTVGAVLVGGLRDLSGLLSPSVVFSAREWLSLGLYGFVPLHGANVGEAALGNAAADHFSEYGLVPNAFRVLFEARAFY